ncbi:MULTISPECIES: helix-turn-helix domain-containing protein [unclassified Natrinema]|nr:MULTISPECIES: helix-turn-helix domain-containing protein [unclassified Natrinema]AFO56615.1 putative membrane-associated protein/domain-like protein [Natrinema sp. J7-2]
MSSRRRGSTLRDAYGSSSSGAVASTITVSSWSGVLLGVGRPLQLDGGAHLAAIAGMVALAVLGGILVARNRYEEPASAAADSEPSREEFVTDRERVQQLLRENGGRMKQSQIVDSVDWSKAKVSRLLADLEDDGRITKLRLGRENLVCLPGHEPTASKSPEQVNDD